ncbi:MAG TPA: hypothetical protein VFE58_09975 [Tepidisphaeraceae bacterium]|jgi:hypothetical protein|nr:hypothetical protein [Tepidisphaeraceae bacterium]
MTKRWILAVIASAGLGLGCSHMHHHDEEDEDEGTEIKMTFDQVPPAVQATLTREANGAMIKSVDKEDRHGHPQYETDVMQDGKNWEIRVSPDGTLISKKIDNEEDEHQGKKDKEDDEKGEHEHKM